MYGCNVLVSSVQYFFAGMLPLPGYLSCAVLSFAGLEMSVSEGPFLTVKLCFGFDITAWFHTKFWGKGNR